MTNSIKILLLYITSIAAIAQNQPSSCTKDIDLAQKTSNIKYFEYPSETKVGMNFTNQNQVKNATPEELMASVLCADTQAWVSFNDLEPTAISQEKVLALNKAKRNENYFHLLSKLEFQANGLSYALIKFRLTVEAKPKPLYMAETMVFVKNRWKRINESALTNLIFMLGMTKQEYLKSFFEDIDTSNNIFNSLKKQSETENNLSINKFINVTQDFARSKGIEKMQFMLEPDNKLYSKSIPILKKFEDYTSKETDVNFSYPLRKSEYCYFFENETNRQLDSSYFGRYILGVENIETNRPDSLMHYYHSYSFNWNENKITIIKVLLKKEFKVYLFENQLATKTIPENLKPLRILIQTLKPDSFWAFYNSEPSGIKEIDAIKARFKNSDGILDIDKLGAYLKTKPKELAKYCDF